MIPKYLTVWAILATVTAASVAVASRPASNQVIELAFNPEKNFWGDDISGAKPILSVLYRGDDYGVPVYSLSIAKVRKKLTARMVRSSGLEADVRPRQAGYRLISKIESAKAKSETNLKSLLDAGVVDWLEADLDNCPGAAEAVAAVQAADWSIERGDEISIVLHADTIRVTQHNYLQELQYSGWLSGGEGHVTTAVLHLAATIKPCWKPAASKAPWHRRKPEG